MNMNLKKVCSILTALTFSLGMLAYMPGQNIQKSQALLVDNDFEIDYDGWTHLGDATSVESVFGVNADSSRSMYVSNRLTNADGASSDKSFYIEPGKSYEYNVDVYHEENDNEYFKLDVTYLLDDMKTYETVTIAKKEVASSEWTTLNAKFTAPKGSSCFVFKITTDSTADFFFDNFKITGDKFIPNTAYAASAGLKDIYANYFRVGSVLNGGTVKQSPITSLILREYNSITMENEMKPDATMNKSKSSGTNIGVSLGNAASILDFCAQNNIGVRGHTLVWHSQTPEWVFKENFDQYGNWVSESVMDQRMESYIKNMFAEIKKQYPTLDLYAYDVCNECVSDDSNRTKNHGGAREPGYGNGKSPWVQVYGSNKFVEKAFTYARKYAPENCALFYNDYNEYWDHKRDAIASMCESLYKKGVLDGIGMQSHINAAIDGFSGVSSYTTALKKYASIGCQVQITELDVSTESGKYASSQADKYKAIFKAAVDVNKAGMPGKVTAVCVWGPNDANTWIKTENAPLLHDTQNQPKDAYYAVAGLIPESEWGDGNNPPGTQSKPIEPDANGYYFHDDFESSTNDWNPRGAISAELSNSMSYSGSKSICVSNRESSWNGIQKSLSTAMFKPGNEYCFSANVAYSTGSSSEEFLMTFQYEDASGETQYVHLDTQSTIKGEFVQLYNKNYKIPSDASNLALVIETPESLVDFYVDDIIGAVAGTSIDGPKPITVTPGDINSDGKINISDLCLMKSGITNGFANSAASSAADVNADGSVNIHDVISLCEYLAGISDDFKKKDDNVTNNNNQGNVPSVTPSEYMKNFSSKVTENAKSGVTMAQNGVDYGSLKKYTYYSTTRERTTNVNVLLPAGYDSSKKYPVLYAMHGYWENEDSLMKMGAVQNMLGNLIASNEAEEMIVVFPYIYTSKTQESCSGMDLQNSLNYDNFINDLFTDLMPYIEKTFSVKTGRENTAITGFSMGGRESLFIGLTRSDVFGYIGSACPAPGLTPGDPSSHPGQIQENEVKPAYDTPYLILLSAGGNDTVVYNFPESYHNMMTKNGAEHIYHFVNSGGHGDSTVQPHFYNLLRGLFKAS